MKEICGFNQEDFKKISMYYEKIMKDPFFKNIMDEETIYIYKKINIKPFDKWDEKNSPQWWESYNDVKHERVAKYKNGNLENVLYALSALYILERYKIKDIANKTNESLDIPEIDSKVFRLKNLKTENINLGFRVMGRIS